MENNNNTDLNPKIKYETPKFTIFGKVSSLTLGGSGNANEGSQGQKPRP